ncbi:MAG: ribonuclease III, partial [Acidimicrobiia bacterium]|nr:ribonuclease III [Acidimicrobiia bacterium]
MIEHELVDFCRRLGHTFHDQGLLTRALTHRSYCAENIDNVSNERLEFLGDSVLGLVVTNHIFLKYPHLPEGQLAKLRASVVNTVTLAELASELDLGTLLRLGKGEDQSGGREKESILADALEAVLGAVYVDGGWDAAEQVILALTH